MPESRGPSITSPSEADLAARANGLADRIAPKVIQWRREIHANPELACQEHQTSAMVAEHLRSIGLDEVRTGLGGGTGVIGVLRGSEPVPLLLFGRTWTPYQFLKKPDCRSLQP